MNSIVNTVFNPCIAQFLSVRALLCLRSTCSAYRRIVRIYLTRYLRYLRDSFGQLPPKSSHLLQLFGPDVKRFYSPIFARQEELAGDLIRWWVMSSQTDEASSPLIVAPYANFRSEPFQIMMAGLQYNALHYRYYVFVAYTWKEPAETMGCVQRMARAVGMIGEVAPINIDDLIRQLT